MPETKHGTAIEWTHLPGTKGETWNPVRARSKSNLRVGWHCEHVDEGCRNCYAEKRNRGFFRLGTRHDFKPGNRSKVNIYLDDDTLTAPLRWKAPRTIFVCSMTDLFGPWVSDDWLDRMFAVMALCSAPRSVQSPTAPGPRPQHTFIVLTKRPERARDYISAFDDDGSGMLLRLSNAVPAGDWPVTKQEALARLHPEANDEHRALYHAVSPTWPLPNVWLGTSVSEQASANARIPILLNTPAAIRFVSYEPALGPVDFINLSNGHHFTNSLSGNNFHDCEPPASAGAGERLDWIIAGGESGSDARCPRKQWFTSVRHQCAAVGVPFFFKQWGEWHHDGNSGERIGKARAGALLDGREHRAFPQAGVRDA